MKKDKILKTINALLVFTMGMLVVFVSSICIGLIQIKG